MKKCAFLLFLLTSCYSFGQQMVYKPINPAFGGDTFNYNWLLSAAQAQNGFTAPVSESETLTQLEEFQQNLNSQILGNLSRNAFDSQFEDGLQEGSFIIGDLALEIFDTVEGLVVNILNVTTGEQTQIIIPN
jgi:curli production assembly/transport component CsgF